MYNKINIAGLYVIAIIGMAAVMLVVGLVVWSTYGEGRQDEITNSHNYTSSDNRDQQNAFSELNSQYFEPANISLSYGNEWQYDTTGLTMGFGGRPDKKQVILKRFYQKSDDAASNQYTIYFVADTLEIDYGSPLKSFDKLGKVSLGDQTLYILRAHYDEQRVGMPADVIVTSACADSYCPFKINKSNIYFMASAGKGAQVEVPLDEEMIPDITFILQSMRLGGL